MPAEKNTLLFTTKRGVKIFVAPGSKSRFDFRVRYQEPNRRVRTPKHIHWVIDLYIKREHERNLTNKLLDLLIEITRKVQPSKEFPPQFQFFAKLDLKPFESLDRFGEYTTDFLIATVELIMIQEKTNYPAGILNLKILRAFRNNESIFKLVSAATFR